MLKAQEPQPFPQEPILVIDPITKLVHDLQPLYAYLHSYHGGDWAKLAEALHTASTYPLRDHAGNDPADALRRHFNLLDNAGAACDSITVRKNR